MRDVYLCVSIDCECDKGPGWRSRAPLSFVSVVDGIAGRLQPLFERHGARPTYLLSPEVLRDDASLHALRTLDARGGCELGTHLHGEYAEPGAHLPQVTADFQRDYPPELERAKLGSLTAAFARAFGRAPRSFRAGRFGVGAHTLGFLAELGYSVDSSVTPHMNWADVGAPGLDFAGAPTQPYHPDPARPGRPGACRLIEIPVTIRPSRWFLPPRWLRPTRSSAARLIAVARAEISAARARARTAPVVLNAMFHNVEIIPGASPYAQTEAAAARILASLAGLLAFARDTGIRVVGLDQAAELYTFTDARSEAAELHA